MLVVGEIQNTANLDFFFKLIFRLVKETLAATTWIFALLQLTIGMTGLLDIYIYTRVVQRVCSANSLHTFLISYKRFTHVPTAGIRAELHAFMFPLKLVHMACVSVYPHPSQQSLLAVYRTGTDVA